MGTIRLSNVNDSNKIEELIEGMIGDKNPKETAKFVANDFFKNS